MSTVLITGASRGIGRELVRQYAASGWQVIAVARNSADLQAISPLITVHTLDVTDRPAVHALAATLRGQAIDVLIANAGIYGSTPGGLGAIDYASWEAVLRTNVLAPASFAEAFADNLAASERRLFAVISSGMGSIAETSGGCYAYRSSKAAVNMVVRNLALDWQPRGIRAVALCPGWVKTDMGGPHAELTPEQSVTGLRAVIETIDDARSGRSFSWNGREVPW